MVVEIPVERSCSAEAGAVYLGVKLWMCSVVVSQPGWLCQVVMHCKHSETFLKCLFMGSALKYGCAEAWEGHPHSTVRSEHRDLHSC